MKPYTKVYYRTPEGKLFKTIAPVNINEVDNYINQHYSGDIQILSKRQSVKTKYKNYCNILVCIEN